MIKTKIISKKKQIIVTLQDSTRLMEIAANRVIRLANFEFGIDEYGHSDRVKKWERSCCSIRIKFDTIEINGGMCGWEYNVMFTAWCEIHEDDEE